MGIEERNYKIKKEMPVDDPGISDNNDFISFSQNDDAHWSMWILPSGIALQSYSHPVEPSNCRIFYAEARRSRSSAILLITRLCNLFQI